MIANFTTHKNSDDQTVIEADGPILFVRMDRIGDLTLTLASDSVVGTSADKRTSTADWWISPNLGFIADHAEPRRRVREMPNKVSFADFRRIIREVRMRSYRAVVVFHAPWWVSPLLWLARIPVRIGVKSQWHTFLFLNKGVRQKRSLSEMSEFEYNVRLVEEGFGLASGEASREPLRLAIDAGWQTETLREHGLSKGKYSVVHPGMSGSARNWPTSHYISWIQEASQKETIVVTGSASDAEQLDPIRQALAGVARVIWLDTKLTGPQLLHVLDGARCILAPSTGIAHLGATLGRPVIGLYSPVKVQHPRRWGPVGKSVRVLVPEVECPGKKNCIGPQCPQYDCMNRISLDSVRKQWEVR